MKKNKRHLYKRLPKYALGTMKPIDLGYQPGRGIGSAKFDTEQNMSLEPETQAIRKSALPNALGYIAQQTPYITESLKSSVTGTKTAGTAASSTVSNIAPTVSNTTPLMANTSLLPTSQAASVPMHTWNSMGAFSNTGSALSLQNAVSTIGNTAATTTGGITSQVVGTMADKVAQTGGQLLSNSAQQAVDKAIAQSLPTKLGTSTLGTALGAIGTAIGGYTMANQIAGFGDHRSASDMLANVGRQHITTDMGNSYTNYNGVNAGQELAYEKANARSKQLGFGINSIGTGASLGGMLGSMGALGSIGGPLGTALGAGVGLLLGGLGSLFGWGDNSEEIERLTRLTNDNIAMYNRQQEAVAKSKDVAAEFSDRQGVSAAATGKGAYQSMDKFLPMFKNKTHGKDVEVLQGSDGPKIGIATSMGEKGEGAYNFETRQGSIIEGFEKGKGDAQPLYHTDGDSTVIFSKKLGFADIANPYILDTQRNWNIINNMKGDAQTQQVQKAVATAKIEKNDMKLREINDAQNAFKQQMEMKKYKNGKLPGFESGKRSYMMPGISDYLINLVPHLYEFGVAKYMQDRYKNASTYVPNTYVQNNGSANAINKMLSVKWDPTHALNDARKAYNQTNWEANRMAGLGAGAQAVLRNTNFLGYLDKIGDIRSKEQEINNNYTLAGLNKAIEHYDKQQQLLTDEAIRRFGWQQQQNAVKEYGIDLKGKDKASAFGGAGHDLYGVMQMARSMGIQNQMLDLYDRQVENDKVNAQAALANANANRSRYDKQYNSSVADLIKTYNAINGLYNPTINPLNVLRMIR